MAGDEGLEVEEVEVRLAVYLLSKRCGREDES